MSESCLSSKRKELRFQAFENGIGEKAIFEEIEKQDKEFIRLLKEETGIINCDDEAGQNALKIINTLAGKELI